MTKTKASKRARELGRRDFIEKGSAVAAATALPLSGCGDDEGMMSGDRTLRILQWNHFVPSYDTWFDEWAMSWATANNVELMLEHVALGDLNGRVMEAIANGEGPDLVELVAAPSALELDVMDLSDVNMEAQSRFGSQRDLCRRQSYNPNTDKWYGLCHGWVPDPGNYLRSQWEMVGLPNGPSTYDELLTGGRMLKSMGIPMGLGMSPELDSNMATRALMWSFGASVQDADGNLTINSPETLEAIEFMKMLFMDTMDTTVEDIFNWTPASNNQALVAGRVSYIINSISAYRTAQDSNPDVASDIFFTPAIQGPSGMGWAGNHVVYNYVIPSYSNQENLAKDFILDFLEAYDDAVQASKLYNLPAFPDTAPMTEPSLANDPFGSMPDTKLSVLQSAIDWTTNAGHPGPASAPIAETFNTNLIPIMFAKAVRGDLTSEDAVAEAEEMISAIFERWATMGL